MPTMIVPAGDLRRKEILQISEYDGSTDGSSPSDLRRELHGWHPPYGTLKRHPTTAITAVLLEDVSDSTPASSSTRLTCT
jgi:hypothetical protein